MINQVPAELECSYIGGQWISNASDHILVYNPATLAPIGRIPNLGKAETIEAVTSAQNAFIEWSRLPAESRSDLLWSLHAKIQQCRRFYLPRGNITFRHGGHAA